MSSADRFTQDFLEISARILDAISIDSIEQMADVISAVAERGGRMFFAGSGGGAGHASHATCDFRKIAGVEAYCVSDNVSELTARVNDESWEDAYSNWLRASNLGPNDALFVFSVGGGSLTPPVSMNLVKAIELALERKAEVLGIVGKEGGFIASVSRNVVIIPELEPGMVTPQTEGMQALLWHLLVSHPKLSSAIARWEAIAQ